MYDTNKIKEWKLAVQEEINRLISDRALALRQIVLSEIAPGDRLQINMGLATLEDRSGQSYKHLLRSVLNILNLSTPAPSFPH